MPQAVAVPEDVSIAELEVWFVVDISGSIRASGLKDPIERGLTSFKKNLTEWVKKADLRARVRTMFFSEYAEWVESVNLPDAPVQTITMRSSGLTKAAAMLDLLSDALRSGKRGLAYVPPVIVLISDGMPTDDYGQAMEKFLQLSDDADAYRVSIAIGPDASLPFCRAFSRGTPYDALVSLNGEAFENSMRSVLTSCETILKNSRGSHDPLPLPRSIFLPSMTIAIVDPLVQSDETLVSAAQPLAGKYYSSAISLKLSSKAPEDFDLASILKEATAGASVYDGSVAKFVVSCANTVMASVVSALGGQVELLSIVISSPSQSIVMCRNDLLLGCSPPLSTQKSAWSTSSLGGNYRIRGLHLPYKAIVISSPEFCDSFGHGSDADSLAAEVLSIYRDRGESFVRTLAPTWASRAHSMTGTAPYALAALFAD
jgi:uncharacterized protein YegL